MKQNKDDQVGLNGKKNEKLKIIRIVIQSILIVGILVLAVFSVIKLYPMFMRINDDEAYRQIVIEKISSYGSFSWLILIGIQIVQTILAVIPSGPVVIITGIMYNPWIASIICLVGQTLGAIIVIHLVKLFGYTFISLFIDPEQTKKFKILQDGKRCGVLMFSYLLIPILPKDPIAFIVPFTKVKVKHFIWINLLARAPMTIVTSFLGSSIVTGNYVISLVLGIICGILALLCLVFNKKIVGYIDKIIMKINASK